MHGLPLSWDYVSIDDGRPPILRVLDEAGGVHIADHYEKLLIERTEALSEAAQRSMLLLRALPMRLDACTTSEEAARTITETLYEAEAALHYVLTGKELKIEQNEAVLDHSEASEGVSEDLSGLTEENDSDTVET